MYFYNPDEEIVMTVVPKPKITKLIEEQSIAKTTDNFLPNKSANAPLGTSNNNTIEINIVSKVITWVIDKLFARRNNTNMEIVNSIAPTILNK